MSKQKPTTNGRMVDPTNPPANEPVRLMVHVTGVMSTPEIFEGETSGSGKTIFASIETYEKDVRLDAETIFRGHGEYRDGLCIQLYTRAGFQTVERANHGPGAQAGTILSDIIDLPEPTHIPADLLDEDYDGPDAGVVAAKKALLTNYERADAVETVVATDDTHRLYVRVTTTEDDPELLGMAADLGYEMAPTENNGRTNEDSGWTLYVLEPSDDLL